jgi:hypothetical protein
VNFGANFSANSRFRHGPLQAGHDGIGSWFDSAKKPGFFIQKSCVHIVGLKRIMTASERDLD